MSGIGPVSQTHAVVSAAEVEETLAAVSYTTEIKGKSYGADVLYLNGEYVAGDPNLPGAEAAGGSVKEAEDAWTNRLDSMV